MSWIRLWKSKASKVLASALNDVDMNGLRDLGDQLKEKLGEGVVVLASACGGKSQPDGNGDS